MRTFFAVIAIASAGFALAACTGERFSGSSSAGSSAANSYAYEAPGSIARAPLSAPPGYGSQPGYGASQGYGPSSSYGSQPGYGASQGYGPSSSYGSQPGYGPGYGSQQGYGAPPPLGGSSAPPPYGGSPGYGSQAYGGAPDAAAPGGWRASPRWSAVEGNGCIEVEQGGAPEPGAPRTQVRRCAGEAPGYPAGTDDQAGYY